MANREDTDVELDDYKMYHINISQYAAAGWLGCLSLVASFFVAMYLGIVVMDQFKILKGCENIVVDIIWIVLAAIPLWLSGKYQIKQVPSLGYKWGLWIVLPITFFNIILIPFGNLGMSMERNWIIVGAIGTAIATFSAWYYSTKAQK